MIDVIVVAGGRGRRFGGKKQWMDLKGRPVAAYPLEVFDNHPLVSSIYLGAPREDISLAEKILSKWAPKKGAKVYPGGEERYITVEKGLSLVRSSFVAVHDAVRPFVKPDLLNRLWDALKSSDAHGVVPALPIVDTVKQVYDNYILKTVDRNMLKIVQTPQLFVTDTLRKAYSLMEYKAGVTDDASLLERAGFKVAWIYGDKGNFKITSKEDWEFAEMSLASPRVGFGYDIHRICEGESVVLGGVRIDCGFSLAGHSDADVLIHAVVDALLGAAGLGDIGEWFPDTDERYRGANSMLFLRKTVEALREKGLEIAFVDATVVAQRPKLSPYKRDIRRNLAKGMGIAESRVSVKAKTKEGLDAVGRLEAIEAYAVVLLV